MLGGRGWKLFTLKSHTKMVIEFLTQKMTLKFQNFLLGRSGIFHFLLGYGAMDSLFCTKSHDRQTPLMKICFLPTPTNQTNVKTCCKKQNRLFCFLYLFLSLILVTFWLQIFRKKNVFSQQICDQKWLNSAVKKN